MAGRISRTSHQKAVWTCPSRYKTEQMFVSRPWLTNLCEGQELVFDPIGIKLGELSHFLSTERRREGIFEVHRKDESRKYVPSPVHFVSPFFFVVKFCLRDLT
jgi:hypothetical protein